MWTRIIVTTAAIAMLAVSPAVGQVGEGPFGLTRAMTKTQAQAVAGPLKQEQYGIFSTRKVPRPHPSFDSYILVLTDSLGLCKIGATGKVMEMNAFGTQIRAEFDAIKQALVPKYGEPETTDVLQAGSIWNEPEDWAMALLKEERTLAAWWTFSENPRADHISAIQLKAKALSTSDAYVVLHYEFDTATACLADIRRKTNAVF